MRFIEPLVRPRRDLLVNVMFNHVNRFKDDPRAFLRDQMKAFFGLEESEVPPQLGEDELMSLYRAQLRQRCKLRFAADLAVPHPTKDRTWFRLVVGGNNSAVIELFRDVERKVVGDEAGPVREQAARRSREARSGQTELQLATEQLDRRYDDLRAAGLATIEEELLRQLRAHGQRPFRDLWPAILESLHVTKSDVATEIWRLYRTGIVTLQGVRAKDRTTKDEHLIGLPTRI
jgi:hypothetical protein